MYVAALVLLLAAPFAFNELDRLIYDSQMSDVREEIIHDVTEDFETHQAWEDDPDELINAIPLPETLKLKWVPWSQGKRVEAVG